MDEKTLEKVTETLAPLGLRPKVIAGQNGRPALLLEEGEPLSTSEAKGRVWKSNWDCATDALRELLKCTDPGIRLEAAKVLMGRG